jgi:hypothetical protein
MVDHYAGRGANDVINDRTRREYRRLTPAERLARVGDRGEGAQELVARLERTYEEFLQDVQRPEPVLLEEFADEGVRSDKLDRAAGYGEMICELLATVVPADRMRYLVV